MKTVYIIFILSGFLNASTVSDTKKIYLKFCPDSITINKGDVVEKSVENTEVEMTINIELELTQICVISGSAYIIRKK